MKYLKYIIILSYTFIFTNLANAVYVQAGLIKDDAQAKERCPRICNRIGKQWDGSTWSSCPLNQPGNIVMDPCYCWCEPKSQSK
jgi:hypothetical protein